jgi:hypothetical protein
MTSRLPQNLKNRRLLFLRVSFSPEKFNKQNCHKIASQGMLFTESIF